METELIVAASPVGPRIILYQDNKERTNRTRNTGHCVACEHFSLLIQLTLVTDHKALKVIWSNPSSSPPLRTEKWGLRLQPYTGVRHKRLKMKQSKTQSCRWSVLTSETINYTKYKQISSELAVSHADDIILQGTRIVIPVSLEYSVLQLARKEHQGIVKTLLRSKVWFPNIDQKAELAVRNYTACQVNTPVKQSEQLKML